MSLGPNTQYDSTAGGIVPFVGGYNRGQSLWLEGARCHSMVRAAIVGSAGVVVLVAGYAPYMPPQVGTSSSVFDVRAGARVDSVPSAVQPPNEAAPSAVRAALAMSVAEQAREALASLSLNKTQLAEVLSVSRPTLYDWLDGKEPKASNVQRLTMLIRTLASAGVTSARPLSPRFLRQPLSEGQTILEALCADAVDDRLVSSLVREAKALGEEAEIRRISRENRLRALGFEAPSEEQRRENLAQNIAMRDWPKG